MTVRRPSTNRKGKQFMAKNPHCYDRCQYTVLSSEQPPGPAIAGPGSSHGYGWAEGVKND